MARSRRHCPGGVAYHAMNRAIAGLTLFETDAGYAAFERVLAEARERFAMRLCAYCLMPNHWHLALWPRGDGDLSGFMQWATATHTQRWRLHRHSVGRGHVYQGRFKSFPIEQDHHFLSVCRYVERNALRANLAPRAERWPWGSLACRLDPARAALLLDAWPLEMPANWEKQVNQPQTPAELEALRRCVGRGSPYGGDGWTRGTAAALGLSLRPRGRPRKPRQPQNAGTPVKSL